MLRMLQTIDINLKQKGSTIERMKHHDQILAKRCELTNLSAEVCKELETNEDDLCQLRQHELSLSILISSLINSTSILPR